MVCLSQMSRSRWCSWLSRVLNTHKVTSSNLVWVIAKRSALGCFVFCVPRPQCFLLGPGLRVARGCATQPGPVGVGHSPRVLLSFGGTQITIMMWQIEARQFYTTRKSARHEAGGAMSSVCTSAERGSGESAAGARDEDDLEIEELNSASDGTHILHH